MHASRLIGPGDFAGEIGGDNSSVTAFPLEDGGALLTTVRPWADATIAWLPQIVNTKSAKTGGCLIRKFLAAAVKLPVVVDQVAVLPLENRSRWQPAPQKHYEIFAYLRG
jgi:hypothetical protein